MAWSSTLTTALVLGLLVRTGGAPATVSGEPLGNGTAFDDVLRRFNACRAARGDAPPAAAAAPHVWSGSLGHHEIGNLLAGYVNAFVDALLLNRQLVVGTRGPEAMENGIKFGKPPGAYATDDGGLQASTPFACPAAQCSLSRFHWAGGVKPVQCLCSTG